MLKIRPFSLWWKGFTCFKDKSHFRSSHRRCSEGNGVLSNFAKFTGKHLWQSLFFNKVAGFSLWTERLWQWYFHVNFVNFLRTPFFIEHLWVTASVLMREKIEPFTTKYLYHQVLSAWRKSYSGLNLGERCSMLFMFSC